MVVEARERRRKKRRTKGGGHLIRPQVIVFSPRRGPSRKNRWIKHIDNNTYSSLRGMTIDSLVRGSDSSSGGPADGTNGMQACLYRGRTHFGQKRLPQIEQKCQKLGFPPPHPELRHLALLEFFIARKRQRYWAPVCLNHTSRGKRKRDREREEVRAHATESGFGIQVS